MPRSSRTKAAAIRASFGRAERLQREAGEARPAKPAQTRKQPSPGQPGHAPQRDAARPAAARPSAPLAAARGPDRPEAAHDRKPTPLHLVQERLERLRTASDRHQHQRLKEQTRATFNTGVERRSDLGRRTEHDRKRQAVQAILKRVEDGRRRSTQRQQERKRENTRREFARVIENRKALDAAARQKEMQRLAEELKRKAAGEIERDHKRRSADQQTEHRRQTSEVRDRHHRETRSFRSNEDAAMERHHHAIKGIDGREARALADFEGRRNGLAGRIAECIPGRRAENDRQHDAIRKGFEAERLTKHRDFEALKERQFELAQKARLQQAHEHKALFELQRDDRARSQQDYTRDRPALIDARARVLERVELAREREHEHVQERSTPAREAERATDRPAVAFAWATVRMDAQSSANAAHERAEPVRPEAERPVPNHDDGRVFERPSPSFGRA